MIGKIVDFSGQKRETQNLEEKTIEAAKNNSKQVEELLSYLQLQNQKKKLEREINIALDTDDEKAFHEVCRIYAKLIVQMNDLKKKHDF